MERAKGGCAGRESRRIDRVVSLERSKGESRWPEERAAIYAARKSKARTNRDYAEAASIERRRRATLFESRGENESNERRPRRTSAARARSQAKVDKGSPSRTDRLCGWDGGGRGEGGGVVG